MINVKWQINSCLQQGLFIFQIASSIKLTHDMTSASQNKTRSNGIFLKVIRFTKKYNDCYKYFCASCEEILLLENWKC